MVGNKSEGLLQACISSLYTIFSETIVSNFCQPTALMKWTTPYIKLLISIRKDNEKLFNTGSLRKKAIWSRIAEKFNDEVDDVYAVMLLSNLLLVYVF